VWNVHRCGRANILSVVVATGLVLQIVDGVATTVHYDCEFAAKENHHQHHEKTDRWTEESFSEDATSHPFYLCPDEP